MKRFIFILFPLALSAFSYPIDHTRESEQTQCVTKDGYIAAVSEKYLNDAVQYSVDKDTEALQKLFDAGVIVSMKAGVKVYIVDTHLFAGEIEFRLPGDTHVFWTVTEAISC